MNNYIIINNNIVQYFIVFIFFISYFFVAIEEITKIKKSKVVILSSSLMWFLIFYFSNDFKYVNKIVKEFLLEYCELFFFLFVAIVYINTIKFFGFLNFLQFYIIKNNFSYKKIYWFTGFLSFFLSPIADNLTTSLFISSIILSVSKNNNVFISLSFINVIVASNSGGAFSPFGDITTLMIWQKEMLTFQDFFYIFIPSFVSFIIPSFLISFGIPKDTPNFNFKLDKPIISFYNKLSLFLFIMTIFFTIFFRTYFNIPPFMSMMLGLSFLQIFEYLNNKNNVIKFHLYEQINLIEWDTLLFFYGIILSVGALSFLGILNDISFIIYNTFGNFFPSNYKELPGNVLIGILSAFVDNIPITFAVLNMNLDMNKGQWLLITLTTGIGGSLLSIGSASGIALMGQHKAYTFLIHLKYSFFIFIGYVCAIISHLLINKNFFT